MRLVGRGCVGNAIDPARRRDQWCANSATAAARMRAFVASASLDMCPESARRPKTDFSNPAVRQILKAPRNKVLVPATEQKNMTMGNGKKFATGNHPVETLVPMLHLRNAGFDLEIATPTGRPVVLEMWAYPTDDTHVKALHEELADSFANPRSLVDVVATSLDQPEQYAAVFTTWGPWRNAWPTRRSQCRYDLELGPQQRPDHDQPATTLNGQDFLYDGYKMAVFPDSVDKQTPMIGYLPGKMPSLVSTKLEELGATIMNKKADATVCIDRRLVTGASPQAADPIGVLAANTLLAHAKKNNW
ncbi:Protein/nucleic acid deglycase HchA [Nymphon striatum]|nr:Protein/nucleic acid deglycase HchA [Nymphon striatum]